MRPSAVLTLTLWLALLTLLVLAAADGGRRKTRSLVQTLCQRAGQKSTLGKYCGRANRIRNPRVRRDLPPSVFQFSGRLTGTKWCGQGNVSSSYDDLGPAADTDRCCRDHDFCPLSLSPGDSRGGFTNDKPYSVSSCKCDAQFFTCLRNVRSAHSQFVGEIFFNVVKPMCLTSYCSDRPNDRRRDMTCLRLKDGVLSGRFPEMPADDARLVLDVERLVGRTLDMLFGGEQP